MAKVEKYETAQPYEQVAARFRKMAPKCLDATIKTTSQTNTSYQVIVTEYKPTVIVGKDRAELHAQQHHAKGVMTVTKEPAGGYYLMVSDAIKAGKDKTRIEYTAPAGDRRPWSRRSKAGPAGRMSAAPISQNKSPELGIPTGKATYLTVTFASSSFWRGSSSHMSYNTLLFARKGYRYELDVSYVDDIYNVVLYEIAQRTCKKRELDVTALRDCPRQ